MIHKIYEDAQNYEQTQLLWNYFINGNLISILEIIRKLEKAIAEMHELVRNHSFSSVKEEIFFFKQVKPLLVKQYLLADWFRNIHEEHTVHAFQKERFVRKQVDKVERFFLKNKYFYAYLQRGDNHMDDTYFTRLKKEEAGTNGLFNYDPQTTCSHGVLLAKMGAYEQIRRLCLQYLSAGMQVRQQNNRMETKEALKSTGTRTDAAELLYALYYSGVINYGDATVQKIATVFDNMFQTQLSTTIYRDFIDIKNRKKETTKFLNKLTLRLNEQIDERFL